MFGWPRLNFRMAPTFTKSFSFLNCILKYFEFLKKNKQYSGTIKLSKNVWFMGVFIKSKSARADQDEKGA